MNEQLSTLRSGTSSDARIALVQDHHETSDQDLRAQQTRLLYTHGAAGQMVNLGVALAVMALFAGKTSNLALGTWFTSVVLLSIWRMRLVTRFNSHARTDDELARWHTRFTLGAFATAAALGAVWWPVGAVATFEQQMLVTFILGGMSIGAVSVLGAAYRVYVIYASLLCLPATLWFAAQGTRMHLTMSLLTLIFLAAMIATASGHHRTLMRLMTLTSLNFSLRRQRKRLADFASMGADLFWECDAQGCYRYLSEGYLSLTGVSSKHMLGKHVEDSDAPTLLPLDYLRVRGRSGTPLELDNYIIHWRHPDGHGVVLRSNAVPILNDNGEFEGYRGTVRDITEQHRLAERLKHQATHDDLTALVNRREFERRLERMLRSTRRNGFTHAMCYMDLDQFKVVNDTCGHVAGDALLRQFSHDLLPRLRSRDTLARLGGDEFGLLLEHCTAADALTLVNEVCRAIGNSRFHWGDSVFRVTASIGLVVVDSDCADLASAMMAADAACYAAKSAGGDRVHVYQTADAAVTDLQGQMRWVTRITDALDQQRLELVAQPYMALSSGAMQDTDESLHNFEVLVRMREPDGSILLPGEFLLAAERYNLAPRIDQWVVGKTLSTLSSSATLLGRVGMCSINLSGHSLQNERFIEYVLSELESSNVPAYKICFELTETAALTNLPAAVGFMNRVRRLGCRFALDDFGTGASSFGYLRNLPVDFIKIDGIFVRDMAQDKIGFTMVKAIADVARVMGKKTVAEFVEDDEALVLLKNIGVDYAQGYRVGKPRPLESYDASSSVVTLSSVY